MSAKLSAKSAIRIHNARLILARGYVVIRANTMSKCDHAKTESPKLTLTGVSSSYAGSRRKGFRIKTHQHGGMRGVLPPIE
jgi:hypothetical protein